MNERIKELLLKAGWDGYEALDERNQKFAELIVRECMKVTKDYTCNQGWDYSAPVALARHFGVGS